MKRLVIVLLLAVCMSTFNPIGANAEFSDHPNWGVIHGMVTSMINKVHVAQSSYFLKYEKYFQGITAPAEPVDGTESVSVNWFVKPTDQEASWYVFDITTFVPATDIPFQMRIDVYESPQDGWGYILTFEVWYAGIGPDEYGNNGTHWLYHHHEGDAEIEGIFPIFDEWYIEPEF